MKKILIALLFLIPLSVYATEYKMVNGYTPLEIEEAFNDYGYKPNQADIDYLEDVAPENQWSSHVRRTKGFVPVASSFWDAMLASDALPGFAKTYSFRDWRNLHRTTPDVAPEFNIETLMRNTMDRLERETPKKDVVITKNEKN